MCVSNILVDMQLKLSAIPICCSVSDRSVQLLFRESGAEGWGEELEEFHGVRRLCQELSQWID